MNELTSFVSGYLAEAETMQLATVSGDRPWICTVGFAVGEDGALYWNSLRDRRHSQEIRAHGKVAVAVVKDPDVRIGLQVEGEAEEVKGDAVAEAHRIYSARFGDSPKRLAYALSDADDDPAYYVFRPSGIVLFDAVNFHDDPRKVVL